MLCAAQTAFTRLPASASRNIPMICSSLNRLLFMFCSFSQAELHLCHVPLLGVRPTYVKNYSNGVCLDCLKQLNRFKEKIDNAPERESTTRLPFTTLERAVIFELHKFFGPELTRRF